MLETASNNYKLRFDENLLVYAQKPEATAVLEIEKWNGRFHRWVNRGAKGIAVFYDCLLYTSKEEYDVAFDMLLQLASVLETDAKFIIEGLPFLDENAVDIFLEYFAEYIEDGHVLDLLLEIPEDEEEEWEEVSLEDVLDEAYRAIKEMFCGEVKVNEGSEDNRHM